MYSIQFYLNYKSKNGKWQRFEGAKYRLVAQDNKVIDASYTIKDGFTKRIRLDKEQIVRLELYNLSTGKYECPTYIVRHSFAKSSISTKIYYINVERHYFTGKIVDKNLKNKVTNLQYELSSIDGEILVSQRNLINGLTTANIDENNGPFPYLLDKKNIFRKITMSNNPVVKLRLMNSMASRKYETIFYPRLIPIGADKKFREIPLQTIVNNTAPIANDSATQLSRLQDTRKLSLYINSKPGQTYSIEREDGGSIFNPSLKEVRVVQFQDGSTIDLKIPKKFKGNILIKNANSVINKVNINKLDPKIYNANENAKDLSIAIDTRLGKENQNNVNDNRSNSNLMVYLFQMKSNAVQNGMYTVNDLIHNIDSNTFKQILATVLTSYNFDNNAMPAIAGITDTVMERKQTVERYIKPFFKGVYASIDDKKDVLFSIKTSRGKKILSFLHFVKTQSKFNIYLLQAAANTKFLQYSLNTATTAADHLKGSVKGSVVGFVICATAEIVEWWATDNSNIGDLLGALVSTAIKAYIGALACSLAMSGTVALAALAGVALPVLAVVGVGLIVGILVAMFLERLDAHLQFTTRLKTAANIGLAIYAVWKNYLIESSKKIVNIVKIISSLVFLQGNILFKVL